MRRIAQVVGVIFAAGVLAGCGGGYGSSGSSSSPSSSKPASKNGAVSVKAVDGVGNVLVDSKGFALYSAEQEKSGTIRCTGSCTAIWVPLTLAKGESSPEAASSLMSKLGVAMRPDGTSQVTYNGKPLYRFAEDSSPGKVTGDDVSDSFGGRSFTWHVAAQGNTTSSGGGGGYHYGY